LLFPTPAALTAPARAICTPQVEAITFQHVCNLTGIMAMLLDPPAVEDDTPLPFLGNLAKLYLQTHGYDTSSVLHISCSYQQSSSADDFVNSLSCKGLHVTEAKFLWDIINMETPDFTFA
jgi:hypothetical protein